MFPQNPSAPPLISSSTSTPPPPAKKHRVLLYGCGTLVAVLLVIIATVAITLWWIQRPIKPVVLSPQEKAAVEQKLKYVRGTPPPPAPPSLPTDTATSPLSQGVDRLYVPGSKVLKLTEREINGL